jgi:hypothetical protein
LFVIDSNSVLRSSELVIVFHSNRVIPITLNELYINIPLFFMGINHVT